MDCASMTMGTERFGFNGRGLRDKSRYLNHCWNADFSAPATL
jgi:hypothetical protein